MAYVRTLSGLGVDPATVAAVTSVAVPMVKKMMGAFSFPQIHAFIQKAAEQSGPAVAEKIYQDIPLLARSRPIVEPARVPAPAVPVSPVVAVSPDTVPIVAAGLLPDLGGATVPLLIAAGLAIMFIMKK